MYIVRCDCHTAIHLTKPLFTDLSLSRVPVIILSFYQLVLCLLRAIEDRRTSSKWAKGGGNPETK